MFNIGPINYEFRYGMYPMQNKLVGWITKLVWLIWLNVKSQWPLSMVKKVNLVWIKPWSFWWTSSLFDQMFGLSHGQKSQFSQMTQLKVTRVFHVLSL